MVKLLILLVLVAVVIVGVGYGQNLMDIHQNPAYLYFIPSRGPIVRIGKEDAQDDTAMSQIFEDLINLKDSRVDTILKKHRVTIWNSANKFIFPRTR